MSSDLSFYINYMILMFKGGFFMGGGMVFYMVYRYQREVVGCFVLLSFLNNEFVVYKVRIIIKLYVLIRFIFLV